VSLQTRERTLLVGSHVPTVAGNVRSQNGRKSPLFPGDCQEAKAIVPVGLVFRCWPNGCQSKRLRLFKRFSHASVSDFLDCPAPEMIWPNLASKLDVVFAASAGLI
jgi:hypothetical protein